VAIIGLVLLFGATAAVVFLRRRRSSTDDSDTLTPVGYGPRYTPTMSARSTSTPASWRS
jgi:hypothetical protein